MKVAIIGAGISGLSVAHFLHRKGVRVEVLEASPHIGGFAHSFEWNGHTCDWAAHRLFTHDEHILQVIQSLTPLRTLNRVSAVYMGGRWLRDPVDALQLCLRFFPRNTFSIPWTYLTRPRDLEETSFKNYCRSHFGRRLEEFLFSPYTEKMFGIPSDDISVEWARKKVRLAGPLDVLKQGSKKKFNYFYYPRDGGYGLICDALAKPVRDAIRLNTRVTGLRREGARVTGVEFERDGQYGALEADHVVSTIPLTHLCSMTGYEAPLSYRGVAAVYALVDKPHTTKNHWIYYMDGEAAVNRLCEFKNLNASVGPAETSVVCAEVTSCERPDLQEKSLRDLAKSGIFRMDQVLDSTVIYRDFSYPVYRQGYEKDVDDAFRHLSRYAHLHSVGRTAQFEHMEADDCLESALQLVRELTATDEVELSGPRSDLSVEPRVAAVIADAGGEETEACLASLQRAAYAQLRVIVVVGTEARKETLQRAAPAVEVVVESVTDSLAGRYNRGIIRVLRDAAADFVFAMQGNTMVDEETVAALVRVAQRDPEAGILTPQVRLAEKPDCIWSIGVQFRRMPPSTRNIGRGRPADRFSQGRELEFAASSGLLISREALEKAGLFDPGFGCYYEDLDFSRRVRNEGFRIRMVPEARLYHREIGGGKTAEMCAAWGESFIRFYRRHMTPLWLLAPLHFSYLLAREALTGGAYRIPPLCRGAWKGMHRRLGRPPDIHSVDEVA